MASLKSILAEVSALSASERVELLAKLLELMTKDFEADDVAAGRRGLVAWTEMARNESWEEFYPHVS